MPNKEKNNQKNGVIKAKAEANGALRYHCTVASFCKKVIFWFVFVVDAVCLFIIIFSPKQQRGKWANQTLTWFYEAEWSGIISPFIGNGRYGTLEHFAQCSNAIIRGRRLFEIFPSKGDDYSREAINQPTAIYSRKYGFLRDPRLPV